MALNPNEDTEFNDALRKHGILPPKEAPPPSPSPPPSPTLHDTLEGLTLDELRELGEDQDDGETERIVEQFRQQRLAELKKFQHARFGRVYPIGRDDYTREVTEASSVDQDGEHKGKGTGVVCFLYKDGLPRSEKAFEHIRILAQRHPHTKFVSIVGDKCIPNLPDTRIPMLIIYRNGEVLNQIVAWGADRERRIEELEAVLILAGAIIPEQLPPTRSQKEDRDSDDEFDESDDEASSRMRSAATKTNSRTAKNVRGKKQEDDSDSDFDL
ncbi:thioredoxin-like protein [Cristinia sonorae]|uniref:Thioredoxin-like protein n=1 Tax=Cristinia sonorae TaxID=1940300 RepID=A0A8K0UMQ5_9AGAR|nr:thioredoxin-like protein [Cristinia sonorae]